MSTKSASRDATQRGDFENKDQRPMNRREPAVASHKERGLWNFLTWSFFLSQIASAELFVGAAAHAAAEGDPSPSSDHPSALASFDPAARGVTGTIATVEDAISDHPQTVHGAAAVATDIAAPASDGMIHLGMLAADEPIFRGEDPGASGAVVAGTSSNVANPDKPGSAGSGNPDPGSGDQPLPNLPTLPIVVGGVIGVVDGVVDTVDNAVDGLVGGVVVPILGSAGDLLGGTVGAIGTTVEGVGDLLGGTVAALGTTVEGVGDLLGGTVQSVGSNAGIAASATTALLGDVVGTAGAILLPQQAITLPASDDLFSDGRYTEYNIELRSSVGSAVDSVADAAESVADILPLPLDTEHNPPHAHTIITVALDELHIRGAIDGLL